MKQKQTYLDWLSELTHLGYDEKPYIIVSTSDKKLIEGYYNEGKTTTEALAAYKEYRKSKQ